MVALYVIALLVGLLESVQRVINHALWVNVVFGI